MSLALSAAPAAQAADERPPACDRTVVPPPSSSGYPLFAPRAWEWWSGAGFVADWASGRATPGFAIGTEVVKPFDADQRFRLGLYVGASIGHWGDDQGLLLGAATSLRLRWSPWMTDFYDVFVVVKPAGFDFAFDDFRAAFRPGAGLGVRFIRAAALEATADDLVSLGDAFPNGNRSGVGLTISLAYDACFQPLGCDRPTPKPPQAKPLTCDLYNQATALCRGAADRAALCHAVYVAMDASRIPVRPLDATDAFLAALSAQLSGSPSQPGVDALRALHERLFDEVFDPKAGTRNAERIAAQQGAWLRDHCSYEPTAIELRDALGCDVDGAPAACLIEPECVGTGG
jgi:hypothetical protein